MRRERLRSLSLFDLDDALDGHREVRMSGPPDLESVADRGDRAAAEVLPIVVVGLDQYRDEELYRLSHGRKLDPLPVRGEGRGGASTVLPDRANFAA